MARERVLVGHGDLRLVQELAAEERVVVEEAVVGLKSIITSCSLKRKPSLAELTTWLMFL